MRPPGTQTPDGGARPKRDRVPCREKEAWGSDGRDAKGLDRGEVDVSGWPLPRRRTAASCIWRGGGAQALFLPFIPVSKKRGTQAFAVKAKGSDKWRAAVAPRTEVQQQEAFIREVWAESGFPSHRFYPPHVDWLLRVAVFRKGPKKPKAAKYPDGRNPRRGDLIGVAHLLADALEGVAGWWANDCQIRVFGPNIEFLCQDFTGFLAVAHPLDMGWDEGEFMP